MRTWDEDSDFRDLVKNDTRVNSLINEQEMKDLFNYDNYTKYVAKIFEKAGL
jgi:adenylosuccinate lyase